MLTCCVTWGCDLTLGPKVKTEILILHPGSPCRILTPGKVRVQVLTDKNGNTAMQDVGAWVAMPPEHWEAVKRTLEKAKAKDAD